MKTTPWSVWLPAVLFAAVAQAAGAEQIVTPYAPVGPVADNLSNILGIPVRQVLRAYDARAWPLATKGFFRFKGNIPDLLAPLRSPHPA